MMFSVLIPIYNAELYLKQTLESVECQTFGDYEIVIDNDGSTDGSLDIIRRFASIGNCVTVLDGPNRGLLIARRKLLAAAKGEYAFFSTLTIC